MNIKKAKESSGENMNVGVAYRKNWEQKNYKSTRWKWLVISRRAALGSRMHMLMIVQGLTAGALRGSHYTLNDREPHSLT